MKVMSCRSKESVDVEMKINYAVDETKYVVDGAIIVMERVSGGYISIDGTDWA